MKAAFVKPGGGVELRQVERPNLEPGSILVKMRASGICGTDLEKLAGRNITSSILGHEVSGEVIASAVESIRIGARVVPHHHVACGNCSFCLAGAGTMCNGFKSSNFVPGGFAEEFLVPEYNVKHGGVHFFDAELSFEEASLAEPLACCIRGLRRVLQNQFPGGSKGTTNVVVVGAGPIGLMHMELLRMYLPEASIVAVDINRTRLAFAEKEENARPLDSGLIEKGLFSEKARSMLSTSHEGFDLAIVATGAEVAFGEALRCIRNAGTLLLFGAPHRGAMFHLDLSRVFLEELTLTASYSAVDEELAEALRLLQAGQLRMKKFITGRYSLENIAEAMSVARSESQVKVLVTS